MDGIINAIGFLCAAIGGGIAVSAFLVPIIVAVRLTIKATR